jgi:hypothetical protein
MIGFHYAVARVVLAVPENTVQSAGKFRRLECSFYDEVTSGAS